MRCYKIVGMRTFALAILVATALAGPVNAQVTVTYVANEGYMITDGERTVLIDALFDAGLKPYPRIPDEMRPSLEGAQPPFDQVDLVLTTHYHRDHFGPKAVNRHLTANKEALYISTEQAVEQVDRIASKDVADRTEAVALGHNESVWLERNGVRVRVMDLHHGISRPDRNYGYLFDLGGMTMIHIGDTEAIISDFDAHKLGDVEIDIAFLPSWFLRTKKWSVVTKERLNADVIIIMHMAEPGAPSDYFGQYGSYDKSLAAMQEAFPQAVVFEAQGASLTFEPKRD